ncbi:MAG: gamma-glutamyl-gamma-aminobutyrate hydrolase family protein [Flaviflexus sp.]|nr:gamma-glutamyl-gamma-aminobutyrate hydrolase family protein [Flaviflexus sp.]
MRRPIIGITTWRRTLTTDPDQTTDLDTSAHAYQLAVVRAGGLPVLLPHTAPDLADRYLEVIDGLIVAGGSDIMPSRYGCTEKYEGEIYDANRDKNEINLLRAAKAADLPTLGICRGLQAAAVAFGGTLIHDIPVTDVHPRFGEADYDPNWRHDVEITGGSRLARLIGQQARVNSLHHQAVQDPGELRVIGHAADGIIEACDHEDWWFIGVQWHPERMIGESGKARQLFQGLVSRARLDMTSSRLAS